MVWYHGTIERKGDCFVSSPCAVAVINMMMRVFKTNVSSIVREHKREIVKFGLGTRHELHHY